MVILGGVPNHGKSTFADALMVNMAHLHKWKMCVYSPENHPLGIHAWHLVEKFIGKPMLPSIYGERVSEKEMAHAGVWIDEHFRFLDPLDISVDGVLLAATLAYEAEAFNMLVIDPWNEIDSRPNGISETEWVSLSLSKFRRWCRERSVTLLLVVHPRKLERDKDGKYPVPTAWDLAGSAHWRNKADAILTYWRDFEKENTAEIHVQKIRFGYSGKPALEPVNFYYHPSAKVFTAQLDFLAQRFWKSPYNGEGFKA
jgi:twinkle protein